VHAYFDLLFISCSKFDVTLGVIPSVWVASLFLLFLYAL
jgi:hypothetical protein